MKKNYQLRMLIITALFAAITCALTFSVRIPTPLGYTHPGDSIIYLAACVLPFPYALFAAAMGGALADLLAGYPQWAIPTLIIKALISLPYGSKSDKILTKRNAFMVIPAGLITVAGYFGASWIMYDWASAFVELTGYLSQAAISAVMFVVLAAGLDRIRFKQKVGNNI